ICVAVELLSLLLVSVLWGCTNPFLKRGTEGIENVTKTSRVAQVLAELKFLFLNVRVSLSPQISACLNALSFAVPVANSLTLLCTLLTGKFLGEEFGGKQAVIGMFLTMAGITLCFISSIDDTDRDTENQNTIEPVH
uniref:Transmembrane protein 234 n=1 Tax=Amphilophus citrinellus TaxID=61819 RepID=A0A3Q0RDJ0_AMPCI